jgi:arylformamidase
MVLAAPWADWGLPEDMIKSACLTSGLYDLEPVRHTSMNAWLHLDATMAARLSPVRHIPSVAGPLTIAVGGRETGEFRRQTQDYVEAWRGAGHPVRVVPMPEHNHYSLMLELGDPHSPLVETMLPHVLAPSGQGSRAP